MDLLDNPKLAIKGGNPVRRRPFAASCFISNNEKEMIIECLESNQWSSFKGAAEGWDIKEVGRMPSKEAAQYGPLDIRFLGGKYVRHLESLFAEELNIKNPRS